MGGESLISHKKVTHWAPKQEVLGFMLDTEAMAISLPLRKLGDLQERWEEWPATRETATIFFLMRSPRIELAIHPLVVI